MFSNEKILPEMKPEHLQHAILAAAKEFSAPPDAIRGRGRTRRVVLARQAVHAALYELTSAPCTDVGALAERDDTTIMYSVRQVRGWGETKPVYAQAYSRMAASLARKWARSGVPHDQV